MDLNSVAAIIIVGIFVVGLGLTLISLPGNILILLAVVGYGIYDGFVHLNYQSILVVFVLYVIGECAEFAAGIVGARKEKAAKRTMAAALAGALMGGIAGTALFPLIGSIIGVIAGVFILSCAAEYTATGDIARAKRVAITIVKGQIAGTVIKIAAAVGMILFTATKIFNF